MIILWNKPTFKKSLKVIFCLGAMVLISSFYSHAQTNPPISPQSAPPSNGDESMRDKDIQSAHERAKARAAQLRAKSQQRLEARKAKAAELRAARKAKTELERKRHMYFKDELLAMLAEDKVVNSELSPAEHTVKITYKDGEIIANNVNLSVRFGARYDALWKMYNRVISETSYIVINPKSYEIREISETGQSYHFRLQTE